MPDITARSTAPVGAPLRDPAASVINVRLGASRTIVDWLVAGHLFAVEMVIVQMVIARVIGVLVPRVYREEVA